MYGSSCFALVAVLMDAAVVILWGPSGERSAVVLVRMIGLELCTWAATWAWHFCLHVWQPTCMRPAIGFNVQVAEQIPVLSF